MSTPEDGPRCEVDAAAHPRPGPRCQTQQPRALVDVRRSARMRQHTALRHHAAARAPLEALPPPAEPHLRRRACRRGPARARRHLKGRELRRRQPPPDAAQHARQHRARQLLARRARFLRRRPRRRGARRCGRRGRGRAARLPRLRRPRRRRGGGGALRWGQVHVQARRGRLRRGARGARGVGVARGGLRAGRQLGQPPLLARLLAVGALRAARAAVTSRASVGRHAVWRACVRASYGSPAAPAVSGAIHSTWTGHCSDGSYVMQVGAGVCAQGRKPP